MTLVAQLAEPAQEIFCAVAFAETLSAATAAAYQLASRSGVAVML
jgi:hypothetical protein